METELSFMLMESNSQQQSACFSGALPISQHLSVPASDSILTSLFDTLQCESSSSSSATAPPQAPPLSCTPATALLYHRIESNQTKTTRDATRIKSSSSSSTGGAKKKKRSAKSQPAAESGGGSEQQQRRVHRYCPQQGSMPMELACEWSDCKRLLADMDSFLSHVDDHLSAHLRQTTKKKTGDEGGGGGGGGGGEYSDDEEEEEEEAEEVECLWSECDCEAFKQTATLKRHVRFHAFHTKLKHIGQSVLDSLNAKAAQVSPPEKGGHQQEDNAEKEDEGEEDKKEDDDEETSDDDDDDHEEEERAAKKAKSSRSECSKKGGRGQTRVSALLFTVLTNKQLGLVDRLH